MRHLKLLALGAAVLGCHSSRAADAIVPANAGPAAEPVFAALFVDARPLTYDVELEHSYSDDTDPDAGAGGMVERRSTVAVSCRRTVARIGRWQVASIACPVDDGATAPPSVIAGHLEASFVTDGRSLWRTTGDVSDAAAIAEVVAERADLIVGQQPIDDEHIDDDDGREFGSAHKVVISGDEVCVEDHYWGGDAGGSRWCVGRGDGVTEAMWYFDGAESHSQTARVRR